MLMMFNMSLGQLVPRARERACTRMRTHVRALLIV
jgi:hypothetical protein